MGGQVAFNGFLFDPEQRRLSVNGTALAVSAPGLRLLTALLEQPGALLTKEQLIQRVWGSSVTGDNALHFQMWALRKVLGYDLIVTQSGVGYRFIGQIEGTPPQARREKRPHAPPTNRRQKLAGGEPVPPELPLREVPARKRRATADRDLIGRTTQLHELTRRLARNRFITLTGPGGVGKTTLAKAVMKAVHADFPDGVWFVELAAARDPASVGDAIMAALSIKGVLDDHPAHDFLARLQNKRALLVLDNCEQLVPFVSQFAETLLAGATGLSILATSRQPLSCTGEQVCSVLPLPVPDLAVDTVQQARRRPAFQLFVDRIKALDPTITVEDDQVPVVARICRSLDGMPLALEIAAGWAGLLGLETLEEELSAAPLAWADARRTAPTRHHDLQTIVGWSHDLLTEPEQAVLRRVAVFAQAFPLAAAEAVAGGMGLSDQTVFTHLANLVQKSLVAVTQGERRPNYRLLETTRAFALEKLRDAGEENAVRAGHARYLLQVLVEAEREWDLCSTEAWRIRYAPLMADVREALNWTIGQNNDPACGQAIAAAAWPLWRETAQQSEGTRWLDAAIAGVRAETPVEVAAQLHSALGMMRCESDYPAACAAFEQAGSLYRPNGNRERLGAVLQHHAFSLLMLDDVDGAERAADEGRVLLGNSGLQRCLARALDVQMVLLAHRQRYDEASEVGRQAVRLYEALGGGQSALIARTNMVALAVSSDDLATAISDGRALAARLRATPHSGALAQVLLNVVAALVRAGRFAEALQAAPEAAQHLRGIKPLCSLIDHLALGWAMRGRLEIAGTLTGFADRAYGELGWQRRTSEQIAAQRLRALLARALSTDAAARLARNGALLTEASAWAIAIQDDAASFGPRGQAEFAPAPPRKRARA